MQMKLLNVALATALTAVLTGCGSSDGDATYNKQTVAPIDVGSGTSSTELERLKSELAAAKAKGTATEEKLKELEELIAKLSGNNDKDDKGDGSDNKDKGNTDGTGTGTDTSTGTDEPTLGEPVTNQDTKNNIGDAANTGKTVEENNVVGFQAYDRGVSTQFDRSLNPETANTGNATVINHNELENKVLSNIVLARPSVNRVPKTIYAGEDSNKIYDFSFKDEGQLDLLNGRDGSLQQKNAAIVNYNGNDDSWASTDGEYSRDDHLKHIFNENRFKGLTKAKELGKKSGATHYANKPYQLSRTYVAKDGNREYALYNLAKRPNVLDTTDAAYKASTGLDKEANGEFMQEFSAATHKSGLVRMLSENYGRQGDEELLGTDAKDKKRFVVRGQERPVTVVENGKYKVQHRTGVEDHSKLDHYSKSNEARIFGSLSQAKRSWDLKNDKGIGDVPEEIWDADEKVFVENPKYKDSLQKYKLSKGTPNSYQHTKAKANSDIETLKALYDTEPRYFDGNLSKALEKRNFAMYRAGLTAKPIHLNHVQYGRVTVNGDDESLRAIQKKFADGYDRAQFNLATKFTAKNDSKVSIEDKKDTTIDYYFARGLQDTKDMPKEGKVTYLGHALTYGLDNSYHEAGSSNDNTVGAPKKEGVGNFVRAVADFKDNTVKGSIYNVWIDVNSPQDGAVENNLVELDGKITPNYNSVIGDAKLTYNDEKGSFKGAFYGKDAAELGGQFNSITEGYGEAKWGGVFGAQKITSSKIDITNSSEEQD